MSGVRSRSRRPVLVLFLLLAVVLTMGAQERSASLDEPSLVYRPQNYREDRSYPLVVFLPYTGGTARDQARAFGITPGRQRDFFVMLPPGRYSRSDYLPNFTQFVSWMEERVILDIRAVVAQFPVDPDRVYLAGYSLGGDLSWALAIRNADEIAGMVMAGTRASYPVSGGDLRLVQQQGHRIAMLIGNRESPDRYEGMNRARTAIEGAGLEVFYREYNAGHSIPPRSLLQEALTYVLADSSISVAEQSPPAVPVGERSPGSAASRLSFDWSFLHVPPTGFAEFRYMPPGAFGQTGNFLSGLHQAALSYELVLGQFWIAGSTGYESARTTTAVRVAHVPQSLTLGTFGVPGWGFGLDWSWYSFFEASPETTASRRFAVHATMVHGGGQLPLDGRLTARIRAPLSLTNLELLDIANAELRYNLEVSDLVMIEAGVASFAEQNFPATTIVELADNLDHVLRWSAGLAVRYPTRVRWGLMYTGESRRALDGTSGSATRHLFQIQLGYLF